jgi:hypothetical protein
MWAQQQRLALTLSVSAPLRAICCGEN